MDAPWIDISVSLRSSMVNWPGDPPVRVSLVRDMNRGDTCTVSTLEMGTHSGTHMDAPAHFVKGARGIDTMPPDAAIGHARVIEILDEESIKPDELRSHSIRRGERILFKTRNSEDCWGTEKFVREFVFISAEGARYLAERKVRLVGIDYLSVGGFHRDGTDTHRTLLQAGIWLIEGLNLRGVSTGKYHLICLPLKIEGADGAPARALLRRIKPRRSP